MPKSRKTNKHGEENRTAWRTPVKLPSAAAVEPMKSLYVQSSPVSEETDSQAVSAADIEPLISASYASAETKSPLQETLSSLAENEVSEAQNQTTPASVGLKAAGESVKPIKNQEVEQTPARLGEAEFLKLLKTEKMDFYSLAEILRGSSMALYCVLYSESLAKGETRCQIRQTDLMMRAGINNPATLYKQERWLTVLGLISKSVRLGNHSGASYEIRPLETLPLPNFILEQFDGYLSELVK